MYHPTDPAAYPYAVRAPAHLRSIDYAEVFRRQVELTIGDIEARAGRVRA